MVAPEMASQQEQHASILLDLVETIGRLSGQVELLLQAEARAVDSRKELHEGLSELKRAVGVAQAKAEEAARAAAEIKPKVEQLEINRYRAQGALWLMRAMWGLVAAGVGAAATFVFRKFGS